MKTSTKTIQALLVATTFIAIPVTRCAAVITFDNAGQLSQFSLNGAASSQFTFNSTAGVGGGGGVKSTSIAYSTDAAIYPVGVANTIGGNWLVALDYQMVPQSVGPDIRLGFTTGVNGSFDGVNDVWAETYGNGIPKSFRYVADGPYSDLPGGVTMTPGNWARLELNLTKTGAASYNGTERVFDLGPNGLAAPYLLGVQNFTVASANVGAAPTLFAGFFLLNATTAADNFSVTSVPEPSTLALLAMMLVGASASRRKPLT